VLILLQPRLVTINLHIKLVMGRTTGSFLSLRGIIVPKVKGRCSGSCHIRHVFGLNTLGYWLPDGSLERILSKSFQQGPAEDPVTVPEALTVAEHWLADAMVGQQSTSLVENQRLCGSVLDSPMIRIYLSRPGQSAI
jgi:hypothetical protein